MDLHGVSLLLAGTIREIEMQFNGFRPAGGSHVNAHNALVIGIELQTMILDLVVRKRANGSRGCFERQRSFYFRNRIRQGFRRSRTLWASWHDVPLVK